MVARDGEGEYSRLNRLAAEREGARLYASFHADLLYNLGCLAPDNWDGSKPRPAPNLAAAVSDHSMVVYNIDDAGVTGPPLHVALADGSRRDLNEGERVYQARRKPVSLARYQWRRQRWMHEWGDE